MKKALVLGGGGFIGSHIVKRLKSEGYWVRGVDLKYPEFSKTEADEFLIYDLRKHDNVKAVMECHFPNGFDYYGHPFEDHHAFDEIYQFAADMGGAGYVFTGENDLDIMHNSAMINLNVVGNLTTERLFYSSSACIYPQELQNNWSHNVEIKDGDVKSSMFVNNPMEECSLKESDAYPANPDSNYGWEKLFSERLYQCSGKDVRIARYHNIYGPEGTYKGGKEKAPAAICRKVIEAKKEIEIWGSGDQTRSFLYIDDCIDATRKLMQSDHKEPINIGSVEMISINRLAQMVINISGKDLRIKNIDGPVGVQGRNSDNTVIKKVLDWKPKIDLKEGMYRLYKWIENETT